MTILKKTLTALFLCISAGSAYADYRLPGSDCKVRMPSVPGYSVSWSGGCSEGYISGQGTLKLFRGGKSIGQYTGSVKNGQMNGRGSATCGDKIPGLCIDGSRYDGQWEGGLPNGLGVKTWPSGDSYQGSFKGGERTGIGTYTWADGGRYDGQFINGKLTGKGKMTYATGEQTSGMWKDGQLINP